MSDESLKPGSPKPSTSQLEQPGASDASIQSVHAQLLREKPEPKEGFSPIPIVLLFVFSSLIFFCGIYMEKYSGGFRPLVYNENVHPSEAAAAPAPAKPIDPMVLGGRVFTQNCQACHQATGEGLPGAFPPLAKSEIALGKEDRVIRIVLYGLSGPVEVEGKTFNGAMPAWGATLSDEQISAVLTYVRNSWGNKAAPISVDKVKEIHKATSGRGKPWTIQELDPFAK